MTEIRDRFPDRPTLVKAPGMLGSARLGSAHDGERATAALQFERIRAKGRRVVVTTNRASHPARLKV
jgi:hypothetical protein